MFFLKSLHSSSVHGAQYNKNLSVTSGKYNGRSLDGRSVTYHNGLEKICQSVGKGLQKIENNVKRYGFGGAFQRFIAQVKQGCEYHCNRAVHRVEVMFEGNKIPSRSSAGEAVQYQKLSQAIENYDKERNDFKRNDIRKSISKHVANLTERGCLKEELTSNVFKLLKDRRTTSTSGVLENVIKEFYKNTHFGKMTRQEPSWEDNDPRIKPQIETFFHLADELAVLNKTNQEYAAKWKTLEEVTKNITSKIGSSALNEMINERHPEMSLNTIHPQGSMIDAQDKVKALLAYHRNVSNMNSPYYTAKAVMGEA